MKDLKNSRFGRLTVIDFGYKKKRNTRGHRYYWKCQCECGNIVFVDSDKLSSGHTQSCGCLIKEKAQKLNCSHHLSNTRLYEIYHSMIKRCENKKCKNYKHYGAKNIVICSEWRNDFNNFYEWAINNGYTDNLTLDRIDVKGNYEPFNCRWVNQERQQNNRSNNFFIYYKGETKTLSDWCRTFDINFSTVIQRFKKLKWSTERAFTTPTKKGFIKNEYR